MRTNLAGKISQYKEALIHGDDIAISVRRKYEETVMNVLQHIQTQVQEWCEYWQIRIKNKKNCNNTLEEK